MPHQESALKAVTAGLTAADRGKLIMACGTGKTFTSLKIAEAMAGTGKRVLFLVPSLSLLSQTLTEWTQESAVPLHSFAGGKALLARLGPAELQAYLARGPRTRFNEHTLTGEAELKGDIERSRGRGFAVSHEEHSLGVIGVAVALDDLHSLSVAIPTPRFDAEVEKRAVAALKEAAEAVASAGRG